MDNTYAEVGTRVVVTDGEFTGKKATVTRAPLSNRSGVCVVCFDDGENYYWPIRKMILASDVPLLTPKQKTKLGIKDG
jgi:hypothetical protein